MINNEFLDELIENHLDSSKYNNKDVVVETASLFLLFKEDFVCKSAGETFYKLPYKEISISVFDADNENIHTNTFNGFVETVVEELVKQDSGIPEELQHIKECYDKFTQHILLAQVQKQFMLKIANSADIVAKEAQEIANVAQDIAKESQGIAREAQKNANEASTTSLKANEASEDAKKMYDGMIVNYITILGIFASIIITIFGGMQIISATTGLLQANIKLATLILVLSFLTLLIVLILAILLNWISNLKNSTHSNKPIFWTVGICTILIISAAIYIFYSSDTNNVTAHVLIKDKKEDKK